MAEITTHADDGSPERRSAFVRSLWVGLTLVPFGMTSWAAFVYAGARARSRRWLVWAAVYAVVIGAGWAIALSDPDDPVDTWRDVGVLIVILAWPASAAHAFGIRRSFLDQLDSGPDPALEAAERALERRRGALELARADPLRARELGVGRPDLPDAFDGGLVDLNHAPAAAIAALPRMDAPLARRVVTVREELDGFDSVEDLGSVLGFPARTVERLRERAVCLPR